MAVCRSPVPGAVAVLPIAPCLFAFSSRLPGDAHIARLAQARPRRHRRVAARERLAVYVPRRTAEPPTRFAAP